MLYIAQTYEQCSESLTVRSAPWRRHPTSATEVLEWTDRPWTTALVLVCQECNGTTAGTTPAIALKDAKSISRSIGPKGRFRVTGSGCLDVCPKLGVALAVSIDGAPTRCAVARSSDAVRALAEALR